MSLRNYPLATPEGDRIPVDVLEPIALLSALSLTTAAMGAVVPIPDHEKRILEIRSTVDCIIGFNSAPVDGTAEPGVYYLLAGKEKLVIPAMGYISAIALTGTGILYVSLLERWEAMKKDYQVEQAE